MGNQSNGRGDLALMRNFQWMPQIKSNAQWENKKWYCPNVFYQAIHQKNLPGDKEKFLLRSSQKRATSFCDV